MTKEEYILLYEKFLSGRCSDRELQVLKAYGDSFSLEDAEWDSDIFGDQRDMADQMLGKVQREIHAGKGYSIRRNWLPYAAAALAFIALSCGLYFYLTKLDTLPAEKMADVESRIVPGGKKAILTLQDGSQIVLDQHSEGLVARQGPTMISKNGKGQIVYDSSNLTELGSNTITPGLTYNTISTPRGGEYELRLSDNTRVWLNAESSIKFPAVFKGNERTVELVGEAYFEVAKNKAMPFKVISNGNEVEVLGTRFNVNSYPDKQAVTTSLIEGSVRLKNGTKEAMLKPGQQGVSVKNGNIKVQKADVSDAIAWKNGYFVFQDENIHSIMEKVARWYDVEIEYQGEMDGMAFLAKIPRYEHISELLNNLQLTGAVQFKIQGRRIIVMAK